MKQYTHDEWWSLSEEEKSFAREVRLKEKIVEQTRSIERWNAKHPIGTWISFECATPDWTDWIVSRTNAPAFVDQESGNGVVPTESGRNAEVDYAHVLDEVNDLQTKYDELVQENHDTAQDRRFEDF